MKPRIAIIHDWLLGMRGGEYCLEVLCQMFPTAELYTGFYNAENISAPINAHSVTTSPLQNLPFSNHYYRYLLPMFPYAARALGRTIAERDRERPYDLVISVSHCFAKNVPLPRAENHLSYCLTPMRYIWDQYDAYFDGHRLEPVISGVAKRLRHWDTEGASGVRQFVGISEFIKSRIETYYQRDAKVVYPPVPTDWLLPRDEADVGDRYLSVGALVPYKNTELVVNTFNKLGLPLTVVGDGPELGKIQSIAKSNIQFLKRVNDTELAGLYRRSKALVFAAEEDFGIIPVEMQASGRPVICYGKGGALETVKARGAEASGVYFSELEVDSLAAAVTDFEKRKMEFTVRNCVQQAEKFSLERFQTDLNTVLAENGLPTGEVLVESSGRELLKPSSVVFDMQADNLKTVN